MWWEYLIAWAIFVVYILPAILIISPILLLIVSWTILKIKSIFNKNNELTKSLISFKDCLNDVYNIKQSKTRKMKV